MSTMAAVPPLSPRTKAVRRIETANGRRLAIWTRLGWPRRRNVGPYVGSILAVALATVAGIALGSLTPLPNVSMVFLLAVVFSAAVFGIWPALLASVLSFLAYNFFFIEPHYTLLGLSAP